MRYFFIFLIIMFVAVGFAFFWKKNVVEITAKKTASSLESIENSGQEIPTPPDPPESENKINSQNEAGINQENGSSDIEPQSPLANPPSVIKAAYFTGWSAGSSKKVDYIIDLARTTEINAVVIDVKDYSGYVGYDIQIPEVIKYNAKETRISKINALIKKLHDEGIYVIARITIFQDPRLAKARPDLAVKSKATGDVWRDRKGLSWMDPSNKEVWDYNISIAKDASARGFDEINFDYIRFPSDGKINDMKFSSWDEKSPKHETIRKFFRYLCSQMGDIKISADLFGLATVQSDDLGIGQIIEDAYENFDYVAPMVYPSHYASGFNNIKNPASHPYEVIKYSMDVALRRLTTYNQQPTANSAKLRPWLQDFDMGADYNAEMIKKEIQAVDDSLKDKSGGWMMWSPSNVYTKGALLPK